ncbi:hypothetical protein [Sodaliphilus sp.]|uniref:hypothetical protein n=1 Tax=Sodaliphilus sp. TaxID=2815818 RepID=UPI00388E9CFD
MSARKMFLIIAFVLASWSSISAQTSDDNYTPLVREGSEWVYFSNVLGDYYRLYITGDTTVNGNTYKVIRRFGSYPDYNDIPMTTTHAIIREENKRVYASRVDGCSYINNVSGELYNSETQESLLYDFNNLEQFYQDWYAFYGKSSAGNQIVSETTDSCLLVSRNCYKVRYGVFHNVIEGIGAYYDKDGDLLCRPFCFKSQALGYKLVSMKNGVGEYEYFNKDLYNKMMLSVHDANNNKTVDISDVNTVIDAVLGLEKHPEYCYVTEDSDLDVADVNAVINYILKN